MISICYAKHCRNLIDGLGITKYTQEEICVTLREERGAAIVENTPLPPGVCYTATNDGDNFSIVKVEVVTLDGSGKFTITGTNNQEVKANVTNTFNYIRANEKTILSERHSLSAFDLKIQITNMTGPSIGGGFGSAVYVAILSSLYKKNLKPGLAVLGNISIGGAIEKATAFADKTTLLSDNGAKNILVPMENLPEITNIPPTILGKSEVPFYSDGQMLLQKAVHNE